MLNCPAYTMDCGSLISVTTILWCYIHEGTFLFRITSSPKSETRIHLTHSTQENPCTQRLSPLSFSWPRKLQNRAFVKALEDDRQFLESQIKQAKRCAPTVERLVVQKSGFSNSPVEGKIVEIPLFTGLFIYPNGGWEWDFWSINRMVSIWGCFFSPRVTEWVTMNSHYVQRDVCFFRTRCMFIYIYIWIILYYKYLIHYVSFHIQYCHIPPRTEL